MPLLRQSSTGFLKEKGCEPSHRVARGQDLGRAIYSPVHSEMGALPFVCGSAPVVGTFPPRTRIRHGSLAKENYR